MHLRLLIRGILLTFLMIYLNTEAQQWGDYTLYSVQNSTKAYLIDTNGVTYHSWTFSSSAKTGYSCYLLPGGSILRTVAHMGNYFNGGGACGQVQMSDWDGNVTWNYIYSTSTYCSHHDICPMPDGDVLIIAWELKSAAEVTQAGSQYSHIMWPDKIVEVQPDGSSGGLIVWEWHAWDHLIQQYDPSKDNYGIVADHPELLNINYNNSPQTTDWLHLNGVDYNPHLDQIVFSSHYMNEIYVVDHSTTTEEAAGHSGGNSGRGGDILYRWGNPAAYGAPGANVFHVVHNGHWVPEGCPRANDIVVFNNNGISNNQSSVDIIDPPFDGYNYSWTPGTAYEPDTYCWRHACNGHSNSMSSSQQLPNGNMLICIAQAGFIYEIDSNQNMIWSKSVSGTTVNALRYSACYVNGTIPLTPTITQEGDSLVSSPAASYQWFFNSILIPGATDRHYKPLQNGYYQVQTGDSSGCLSALSEPFYFETTGLVNEITGKTLRVFPNPTSGIVYLETDDVSFEHSEMTLINSYGVIVFQSELTAVIDLSSCQTGIYSLMIKTGGGDMITRKILLIK